MYVCLFCVLSGRGLCDKLITRPEESYRLWCVVVCDLEISRMRRPWPALGRSTTGKKYIYIMNKQMHTWLTVLQGEQKVFHWLQTFITRKLRGIQTYFLQLLKLVSKVLCHLFIVTFVIFGFWMQHFQTGGFGEMVRHPGHNDRRISLPLDFFYGGVLRTKCFRHQFQILQIWRQE